MHVREVLNEIQVMCGSKTRKTGLLQVIWLPPTTHARTYTPLTCHSVSCSCT